MSNGMIAGLDVSLNAGLATSVRVNVRKQGEPVELNWYTFQGVAYSADDWKRMQDGEEVAGTALDVSVAPDDESAVDVDVPALAAGMWHYIISATAGGSDTIPFLRGVLGVFAPDVVLAAQSSRDLEAVLDLPSTIAELPDGVGKCRAHWLAGTRAEAAARKAAAEALGWVRDAVLTGYAVVPSSDDLPSEPTESQKKLRWVVGATGKTYVWSQETISVKAEWLLRLDNAGAEPGYENHWMYRGTPALQITGESPLFWSTGDTYGTASAFAAELTRQIGYFGFDVVVQGGDVIVRTKTATDSRNGKLHIDGPTHSSKGCGYTVTQTVLGGVQSPGWVEIATNWGVPDATATIKGVTRLAAGAEDSAGVVTMGQLQEILAGYVPAPETGSVLTSETVEHVEVADELPPSPGAATLYIKPADEA